MKTKSNNGKAARIRACVLDLLHEHESNEDGLPTTIRILFYELEMRGLAVKPDRDGPRKGLRRSIDWPPGCGIYLCERHVTKFTK